MTKNDESMYNKGKPIKCACGVTIAFQDINTKFEYGDIRIKCRMCKRINSMKNVINRAKSD